MELSKTFLNVIAYGFLVLFPSCGIAQHHHEEVQNVGTLQEFEILETRLLDARSVKFDYSITATGVVEVGLKGSFELTQDDYISLTGFGSFAGQEVELSLQVESDELVLNNGKAIKSLIRPKATEEALLVGLTRMGLLHNLALLVVEIPPDHAHGGVQEWVTVIRKDEGIDLMGTVPFDIFVQEELVGSMSLEVDQSGNPVTRKQTVVFPEGEMQVIERYSNVSIIE